MRNQEVKYDFEITCETPKSVAIPDVLLQNKFFSKHFFQSKNFDIENDEFFRTPDLLFHNYENKKHQLIAVEIKPLNTGNPMLYKDLAKLMFYVKSRLQFKKAILMLYGIENRRRFAEIPNIKKTLQDFPEIEIWVITPNKVEIIKF